MPILIVNDVSDNLRILGNLLAGMDMNPLVKWDSKGMLMRVLIVDDVPEHLLILSGMLEGQGIQVSTATNGDRALRIAQLFMPDLVLLAVEMAGMDGYTVCKAMKSNPFLRGIPVIFTIPAGDEESEIRALELGAVDCVTRPFKEAVVKLRIKTHLELKRQREVLENLSRLDGLTGIANRRAFEERLDQERRRASRTREKIALAMVDVDCLKAYNELHGHLAADDCLCQIAATLQSSFNRAGDFVARYDGEEFAVLLPAMGGDALPVVAERMRVAVERLNIPHGGSPVSPWVTVSVGGVVFQPDKRKGSSDLIERAERQLRLAKSAGRNQVRCSPG